MLFDNEDIEREYHRWASIVGEEDPYVNQHCLGIHDVLRAHFSLADFFATTGAGLGGIGPRSLDLLHSALGRQHTEFGGQKKWKSETEICATLFYGIIKNHPFHDANKRTAFLSCMFHLKKLKLTPTIDSKTFEDFTVEIAENLLSTYSRYNDLVKDKERDPEVKFISYYLRRHTREIDNKTYHVTFNEINTIIKKHGFTLDNPQGNYIDIFQIIERRPFFGLSSRKIYERKRLGQVGFPGWKAEASANAIKTIRKVTRLDVEHGCDSKVFFQGYDSLNAMLAKYEEPLRRLAYR